MEQKSGGVKTEDYDVEDVENDLECCEASRVALETAHGHVDRAGSHSDRKLQCFCQLDVRAFGMLRTACQDQPWIRRASALGFDSVLMMDEA